VKESGLPPPSIDDVIALIQEEVFGTGKNGGGSSEGAASSQSRRSLRSHHLPHTQGSRHQRHRALRAHHLPYNHFESPRDMRRLQSASELLEDLLDSLSVEGGYDGEMVYVRLSLDISKEDLDVIKDLLLQPLNRLSGELDFLSGIFGSDGGSETSLPFGSTVNVDVDFSVGVHVSVLVGFEITSNELSTIFQFNASSIAERAFIQFEDVSAKFSTSAHANGTLNIAGLAELTLDDGFIAFAFGIGIDSASPRIYFPNISSTLLVLRNEASWQRVGAMDIKLPLQFSLTDRGFDLPDIAPIISLTDRDLFDTELPDVSIDFDIR
jgi:hypothetical protein